MFSFTFSANFLVSGNDGAIVDFDPSASFTFYSDIMNPVIRYDLIADFRQGQDVPAALLSGNLTAIELGGGVFEDQTLSAITARVFQVNYAGGSTVLMELSLSNDASYFAVLGGLPLPMFQSDGAYQAFVDGIISESVPSGTTGLAPRQYLALSELPNVVMQDVAGIPPSLPRPTEGSDDFSGSDAADAIDMLGGDDRYFGLGGDDHILGNDGDDTLVGGSGDDTLIGGAGADRLEGGAGFDTASYEGSTRSVRVDLQNEVFMFGDAVGDTFDSIEAFQMGDTIDQLRGDAGDNIFYGGGSVDRLYGRAGDDILDGQAQVDALYGGAGVDTMTGGEGTARDRFIYFNIVESGVGAGNRDVITDFVSGQDRIEISRFDADMTRGFNQAFDFVGNAAFTGTAGELRYEAAGGITVVQADMDGDGLADFEVELTGEMSLIATDFLL